MLPFLNPQKSAPNVSIFGINLAQGDFRQIETVEKLLQPIVKVVTPIEQAILKFEQKVFAEFGSRLNALIAEPADRSA
ncbi:MAG: hypothetical protein R2867_05525 [Caldilineaceae bacterium]